MPFDVEVDRFATCRRCGGRNVAWQQSRSGRWYLCEARRIGGIVFANRRDFHVWSREYREPVNDDVRRINPTGQELRWMREIVTAGYRLLAGKHHPDHGGTHTEMQELNAAIEKLRAGLRA